MTAAATDTTARHGWPDRNDDAIARHNPQVNAIVTFAEPDSGAVTSGGALAGVGFTVKDTIETRSMLTTAGSRRFAAHTPHLNAPAVDLLLGHGAQLIGKSNVPTYAAGFETYNALFGFTRNPWDLRRSVGGSSGGGAAAVAAGMAGFDLGSDTAGSLVVPAHFCGVTSHRPTPGLIDNSGHIPPASESVARELPIFGVTAPTPSAVRSVIELFTPAAPGDGRVPPVPARAHRVAIWRDDPACPVDDAVAATLDEAVSALTASGHHVTSFDPPVDLAELCHLAAYRAGRAASAFLPGLVRGRYRRTVADELMPGDPWLSYALGAGDEVYSADQDARRTECARVFRSTFLEVDVVVCPAAPRLAPLLSSPRRARSVPDLLFWPSPGVALGLPVTTTPVAVVGGLPSGVQVIGAPGHDLVTLDLAHQLYQGSFGLLDATPSFRGGGS